MGDVELTSIWSVPNEDLDAFVTMPRKGPNLYTDLDLRLSDDDLPLSLVVSRSTKKPLRSVLVRRRQRGYDQKSRQKRKGTWEAHAGAFVAGLKLFSLLLEDRIERTRMVTLARRVVRLHKSDEQVEQYESDLQTVEKEARKQVPLNQNLFQVVDNWALTWYQSKAEHGRFFLTNWTQKIDAGMTRLLDLGKKLAEETVELECCLLQNPRGVWL